MASGWALLALALIVGAPGSSWGRRAGRADHRAALASEPDPMEPCYLANNRASESLTISESTPVGSVVGEIMVNGDPAVNGNIELSIKLPGGHNQPANGFSETTSSRTQPVGAHRQLQGSVTGNSTDELETSGSHSFVQGVSSGQAKVSNSTGSDKMTIGRPLHNVQATNLGHNTGATVSGSIKSPKSLNNLIDLMPPLSIEPGTKRLFLAKKLDRENLDKYMFDSFQASSAGNLAQSSPNAALTVHIKCQLKDKQLGAGRNLSMESEASRSRKTSTTNSILIPIHLIVTDENDNWPIFINSPYIIDLNESVQMGSLLPGNEILAVDNDQQGPLSTIEYSIVAGSLWSESFAFLNPLDSRSLVVKDNRMLDFEGQSKITLKVMAQDQGEPPNWAIASLHINLIDNDDLNPVFGEDKYWGSIKENRPGEVVELAPRRLMARDGDKNIDSPVAYSFHLKTNHSLHFELDPDLGKLSLKKALPDSVAGKHPFCLLIRAAQVDQPKKWTLTMINLRLSKSPGSDDQLEHLLSISDNQKLNIQQPFSNGLFRFQNPNITVQVSESALPGYTLVNLKANYNYQHLKSSNMNGANYHLLDDDFGYFNLDRNTGKLSLNKSLDYELSRRISIRVLATNELTDETLNEQDSALNLPRLVCDMLRVNIQVMNQNDYTPEFSHEQYNFQLSVSDLIANFDISKAQDEPIDSETGDTDKDTNLRSLVKRFGDEDQEIVDDPLAWNGMQLGQIYCADRDYGDKVKLQLKGTKASLFHLTLDGRLYLPLMNVSSLSAGYTINEAWSSKRGTGFPANQMRGRSLSFRRSDDRFGLPDRDYLNYLLSEFSHIGRLRLKVIATDDGQPRERQSSALIVITIISIDNFIVQRDPSQLNVSPQSAETFIHLSNETSYDTSGFEPDRENRLQHSNQVMMIPSTNGRTFVRVNSDIISNLIAKGNLSQNRNIVDDNNISQLGVREKVDLVKTNSFQNISDHDSKFQPPGLLLVDGDGAKFVAMPAAIEIYNQQVQEANNKYNYRFKNLSTQDRHSDAGTSVWEQWKSIFVWNKDISGFPQSSNNWLNRSIAIVLHLITIAVIVVLILQFRSSSARHVDGGSGSLFRRFNLPNFLFKYKRRDASTLDILSQNLNTYGNQQCIGSSLSSGRSGSTLYHQQTMNIRQFDSSANSQNLSDSDNSNSSNFRPRCQTVSKGVIVKALSNVQKFTSESSDIGNSNESKLISGDTKQNDNLLSHLQVHLKKVIDASKNSDYGIKPVSSTKVTNNLFENEKHVQNSFAKTTELSVNISEAVLEVKPSNSNGLAIDKPELNVKASTFIGGQRTSGAQSQCGQTTAIVSINVAAAKTNQRHNLSKMKPTKELNSSSSSVLSLDSMSSSLSNKINASVDRSGCQATISDVSSLDSNFLLTNAENAVLKSDKLTPSNQYANPPPPPPLPSSLGIISSSIETKSSEADSQGSKPFSSCPMDSLPGPNTLRPLPQNPLHLKLREQASRKSSQGHQVFTASGRLPISKLSITNSNSNEAKSDKIPTPPPLPANISSALKTVSPTTSVDRGYESFQSYASSSQAKLPQQLAKVQKQKQEESNLLANDLKSTVNNGVSMACNIKPSSIIGRNFPGIRPPMPTSMGVQVNIAPIVGRQEQKSSKINESSRKKIVRNELSISHQQQQSSSILNICSGAPESDCLQEISNKSHESLRLRRASQTPASTSVSSNNNRALGRQHHRYRSTFNHNEANQSRDTTTTTTNSTTNHSRQSASKLVGVKQAAQLRPSLMNHSRDPNIDPIIDCETEDDDFYYFDKPDQASRACRVKDSNGAGSSLQETNTNHDLNDYVSHAYEQNLNQFDDENPSRMVQVQQEFLRRYQRQPNSMSGLECVSNQRGTAPGRVSSMASNRIKQRRADLMLINQPAVFSSSSNGEALTSDTYSIAQVKHYHPSYNGQLQHVHPQRRHSSRRHQHGYSLLNGHMNSAKKQLTWSDQIEMA